MGDLVPGQMLDQYELLETVATSGMATIFRARDSGDGRIVAVKVPHLQYASDIVFHQRFLREEQIGLSLDHPGIIKVFTRKETSRLYLVMEYVEGELLSSLLRREHRLPVPTAVDYALQLCDVLIYLHDRNILHRDLKPDNIMILNNGRLKLMDFGIALDAALRKITWTGLSQPVGTPDYMAPEQIKGSRGSARTDIYSLGILLYEMLTGTVPFPGENVYTAMQAKMLEQPALPASLRHDLTPQLQEIILHAIERNPNDRFRNARELREALEHQDRVVLTDRTSAPQKRSRLALLCWKLRALAMGLSLSGK
jgi:serine/threonine-protein kinase